MAQTVEARRPSLGLFLTDFPRALGDVGLFVAARPLLRRAGPRGDGHPVLVLPGLMADDYSTRPLRRYLRRLGYHVHGWRLGRNVGPTQKVVTGLAARLDDLKERHNRKISIIGWSLGGIFALLTAADQADLPIRSLTLVGTPVDVTQVPLVAPLRPLLNLTQGALVTLFYRALGGAPKPLVRRAFQMSAFHKLVTKPLAILTHLDDADFLAQIEAVDRFTANMIAYPGRTFGQLYHRFVKGNVLVSGSFDLDDRTIRIADITAPVLVFGGSTDGIAPVPAVKAVVPLLTGSREVRFEIVPGGHLGMLTGRRARTTTWRGEAP
jgi:polyhydroxyalkanoate synthase